ncbi:MAG: HAD-IIIA family hydrolase, partial [Candidatus Omnitrophica bacterium]|nr:HAD-IIIA family hydrolase [Candidatus Omnitrophota bacterium]
KKMRDMGYRIVVVTTQAGIGLGYYTKEDFYKVNKKMLAEVSKAGITIDRIYFCPHNKADKCVCRKPEPGLILRAKKDLNLDLSKSYFIGDRITDIQAGQRAGTKTILVKTGHDDCAANPDIKPDFTADNLLAAADYILRVERK